MFKYSTIYFLLLFCFIHVAYCSAQGINLSGTIQNEDNKESIGLATILVFKLEEKTPAYTANTTNDGKFNIANVHAGDYRISISAMGFEKKEIDKIQLSNTSQDIGTIYLKPSIKNLAQTTITGQKQAIKMEAGKITADVSQLTIQQGTVKDLLAQIPGVVIDNNGAISIRGKSGIRVLVDGKTSPQADLDLKNFLETIQAGSVQNIEVLTNPSAKYDAEGNSGIINIKLKKEKKRGFNGKINAGIGSVLNKYNAGVFINKNNSKINVFGMYNFTYRDQWFGYSEDRKAINNGIENYYAYDAKWQNINRVHNAKAGIDFFINEKNSLSYTLDFIGNASNGKNYGDNPAYNKNSAGEITKLFLSTNGGSDKTNNITNSINYKKTFDTTEKEWTIDLAFTKYNYKQNSLNITNAYDISNKEIESEYYYFNPIIQSNVTNIILKSDAILPLKNKALKFEVGVKNESNFNNNNYYVNVKNYNGNPYRDALYDNIFSYKENLLAGYGILKSTIKNISIETGLRAEHTYINSNNNAVNKNYVSLFPNAGISAELKKDQTISFSYSRRINRPNFGQLNNRIVYYNRYTANVGLPTLQPQFSNIISISYSKGFSKFKHVLTLGAEYNHDRNGIGEINYIDTNFVSYFTSGNIGKSDVYNIYASLSTKPTKWLDILFSPYIAYKEFYTLRNGINESSKGTGIGASGSIAFLFWKNSKLKFGYWYNSNDVWAQGYSKPMGAVNAAFSKSFLNKKLDVELNCSDIFNINAWRGVQNTPTLQFNGKWKPETRIAFLNIAYKFGKQQKMQRTELKSDRIGGNTGR